MLLHVERFFFIIVTFVCIPTHIYHYIVDGHFSNVHYVALVHIYINFS